jgi:undecaprenyl diphosphate synthase
MRVRVLGDVTGLDTGLQEKIKELEKVSRDNTGLNFQVALNYGSRDEIIRGIRRFLTDYEDGKLQAEDLDAEMFSQYLDTVGIPNPDLLIRTSGEQRLSNFLLWQLAYTEFYFTDVLWPDFSEEELKKAISYYGERERRFGGV